MDKALSKLWDKALWLMPMSNAENGPFGRKWASQEILGLDHRTVVKMHEGKIPTPDDVVRKLRLICGPHGEFFMRQKLKEDGYELQGGNALPWCVVLKLCKAKQDG